MSYGDSAIKQDVVLTPIPSYSGFSNYLADTENGRIWSIKRKEYIPTTPNSNGYVYNRLTNDKGISASYGVHRLIMASVSGIPLEHFKRGEIEVDHFPNEEEKYNNSRHNLQMSSRKGQYRESTRAKMGKGKRLIEEQVCEILTDFAEWINDENNKTSEFIHLTAEAYDQTYRNIWNIVYGKSWKHLHNSMVAV